MQGRSQEHFGQGEPRTEAEASSIRHSSVPLGRFERRGREIGELLAFTENSTQIAREALEAEGIHPDEWNDIEMKQGGE